jgi:tRNA (mo5U34)-methyltransferase
VIDQSILNEALGREWFHRIELAPGVFTPGVDDTPRKAELIQLPSDLRGKRVLDIGAYDGYFSFEAERRGAAYVLAYDHLLPDQSGFSVAHRTLDSKVEHRVGSVYDLRPEVIGTVDVVLFLGVIYHLRSPLLALERINSVCDDVMYLESQILEVADDDRRRLAQFFPCDELNHDPTNWWAPTKACLESWLKSHGFEAEFIAEWNSRAAYRCHKALGPLPWFVTDY